MTDTTLINPERRAAAELEGHAGMSRPDCHPISRLLHSQALAYAWRHWYPNHSISRRRSLHIQCWLQSFMSFIPSLLPAPRELDTHQPTSYKRPVPVRPSITSNEGIDV